MGLTGNCINMHLKAHIYACFRDVVYGFISICFFPFLKLHMLRFVSITLLYWQS